jgi:hypothetical protein
VTHTPGIRCDRLGNVRRAAAAGLAWRREEVLPEECLEVNTNGLVMYDFVTMQMIVN